MPRTLAFAPLSTTLLLLNGCLTIPVSGPMPEGFGNESTLRSLKGAHKSGVEKKLGHPMYIINKENSETDWIYQARTRSWGVGVIFIYPVIPANRAEGEFHCMRLEFAADDTLQRYHLETDTFIESLPPNYSCLDVVYGDGHEGKFPKAIYLAYDQPRLLNDEVALVLWDKRFELGGHVESIDGVAIPYQYATGYRKYYFSGVELLPGEHVLEYHETAGDATIRIDATLLPGHVYTFKSEYQPSNEYPSGQVILLVDVVTGAVAGIAYDASQMYKLSHAKTGEDKLVWLCRAADYGSRDARHELGLIFEDGREGLRRNLIQAYVWFRLSSTDKNTSHLSVDRVQSRLSADELYKATEFINKWKPGMCEKELDNLMSE